MAGPAFYGINSKHPQELEFNKAVYDFFNNADKKGHGFIQVEDVVNEFAGHGIVMKGTEIQEAAKYANPKGELTHEDFAKYAKKSKFFKDQVDENSKDKTNYAAKREALAKGELAFQLIDRNKDGFISRDEFKKFSTKLSSKQIEAIYSKFDEDKDNLLSVEEFRRMLKAPKND